MAIPSAASAAARPTKAARSDDATEGQRGNNAKVNPIARAARTGSGAALTPGSGTKISAPPTRARTSRNPQRVWTEKVRLAGIPVQVSQDCDRVGHGFLKH